MSKIILPALHMTDALLLVASSSSSNSNNKVNLQKRKTGFFFNSAGNSVLLTIKLRYRSLIKSFFFCCVLITAV